MYKKFIEFKNLLLNKENKSLTKQALTNSGNRTSDGHLSLHRKHVKHVQMSVPDNTFSSKPNKDLSTTRLGEYVSLTFDIGQLPEHFPHSRQY